MAGNWKTSDLHFQMIQGGVKPLFQAVIWSVYIYEVNNSHSCLSGPHSQVSFVELLGPFEFAYEEYLEKERVG